MQLAGGAGALTPRQRRQLGWLLLAWAVFITYGSWVPLNFQARDPAQAWTTLWQWTAAGAMQGQRLDTAVNMLLTVPLGFGLALLWAGPGARAPLLMRIAIVLLVLPLSLTLELGQGFLPSRSESLGDVLAQTVGTLVGLGLHTVFGAQVQARLAGLGLALDSQSRAAHLLHLYLVALLLFAVMPLDLTLDVGELYRKWRDGRVIWLPFGATRPSIADFIYEILTDVLLWVPVGVLWRLDAPRRTLASIVARAAWLALAIEGVQLLVLSRVSDVTDVLLSAAGAGLGAGLVLPALHRWSSDPTIRRRACGVGLLVWLLTVVMIYGWPFAWRWPPDVGQAFAGAFGRIPFLTYFQRNEFGALNEILRKLLVFLPGGLLLRLWLSARAQPSFGPSTAPLWLLAGLAVVMEAMQVLLVDRVADLTDALLAMAGAVTGWRMAQASAVIRQAPRSASDSESAPLLVRPKTASSQIIPTGWAVGLSLLLLAVGIWGLARLPGVPYNVIKLVPAGPAGVLSAVGVALALAWGAAWPVVWMVLATRRWLAFLPAWLLLHGTVAYLVLRLLMPLPMLHKIIGTPVLGMGGPWEDLVRYLALHVSLMLPLCGAAALVQVLRQPSALARLLYWLVLVALLAWPLHAVVVVWAATDNLVELMRGGGSLAASMLLAGAVMAVGTCAGALACAVTDGRRRPAMVVLALMSSFAAAVALYGGLEPTLIKYGRVFSALQFILSASRDAYATGTQLVVRYVMALGSAVLILAWLQAPWWRRAGSSPASRELRRASADAAGHGQEW